MANTEGSTLKNFLLAMAWWSAAVLVVSAAVFIFGPIERKSVAKSVDLALENAGDPRRVSAAAPTWGAEGAASIAGLRFALKGKDEYAIVFSVGAAGSFASYVALFHPKRGVDLSLPLDPDAPAIRERWPAGLLETYLVRIEDAETRAFLRRSEK